MSLEMSENVICPNCGRDHEVTFWSTINVSLDPTLRSSLFNGEINQFKCPACGHEITKAAIASGQFIPLRTNAVEKVIRGITTFKEAASSVLV